MCFGKLFYVLGEKYNSAECWYDLLAKTIFCMCENQESTLITIWKKKTTNIYLATLVEMVPGENKKEQNVLNHLDITKSNICFRFQKCWSCVLSSIV